YWYILGEGEERPVLEEKIKANNLQQRFILLGIKENPYPYVKRADLYVQPSRFEGKSIAIDEAKILAKPIVVTNFPSIVDQITHLENGFITEINAQSIADAIESVYRDAALRESFIAKLKTEKLGTQAEIAKLYEIFQA
ncbi:MAG: glycosyltransferase, partial [Flavobacterium sp.]